MIKSKLLNLATPRKFLSTHVYSFRSMISQSKLQCGCQISKVNWWELFVLKVGTNKGSLQQVMGTSSIMRTGHFCFKILLQWPTLVPATTCSPTNLNQSEFLGQLPATYSSKRFLWTVHGTRPCNQSLHVHVNSLGDKLWLLTGTSPLMCANF